MRACGATRSGEDRGRSLRVRDLRRPMSDLAPIVSGVLELIGSTPLVRVRCVADAQRATVWAKCEQLNPGGSVKDRICLAMIEAAEREGRIHRDSVIVEPTSGNTGIGL